MNGEHQWSVRDTQVASLRGTEVPNKSGRGRELRHEKLSETCTIFFPNLLKLKNYWYPRSLVNSKGK